VPEPVGAAHNDPASAAGLLDRAISSALAAVKAMSPEDRLEARYQKFRNMGRLGIDFIEAAS
jgi:acetyl-CoA carboxylase carboxyl transferase subunit alpha